MDKVTVIITTYKRELEILDRAIRSVLNQSYTNLEIILVNDYPQYEVIIKEYIEKLPNINFVSNSINKGANFSRNLGIKMATGKYVALLDDDDEWMPEKVEKQLLQFNEEIKLVYCRGLENHPNGNMKEITYIKDVNRGRKVENILSKNIMGGSSFPIIKKEVFENVGYFDEELESSQDYDMWIKICLKYEVFFLDEYLVIYHISSDSITSDSSKKWSGYKKMLQKYKYYYDKYPIAKCNFFQNMINTAITHHENKKIIKILLKSFSFFPYNMKLFSNLGTLITRKMRKKITFLF